MTPFSQDPRFLVREEAPDSVKDAQLDAKIGRHTFVALCLLFVPLLILVLGDRRVWSWDEAYYGEYSVWLFRTLVHSPISWPGAMVKALVDRAPAISWLGQFFVPLGHLLPYTQTGLLCFVLLTLLASILLLYKVLCRVFGRTLPAFLACCIAASAPLFTGLAYRYFVEPLQLFSVVWVLALAVYHERLSRSILILQIVAAVAFGLLTKTSTPLFQFPGLLYLAFIYVRKRRLAVPGVDHRESQLLVYATVVATFLIVSGTFGWYLVNYKAALQHVVEATSGSLSIYYGSKAALSTKLASWITYFQRSFFWFPLLVVLILTAIWAAFVRWRKCVPLTPADILALLSVGWIFVVLLLFARSINEDTRYLLALLPYVAITVCWAASNVQSRSALLFLFGMSLVQFALVTAQSFGGIRPQEGLSTYLRPYIRDGRALQDSLFCAAQTLDSSPEHPTLVGEELPEFNGVGLSFYSTLLGHGVQSGKWSYSAFDWTLKSADEAWQRISQISARYYVFRKYDPALDADVFNHLSKAEFERVKHDPEFRFRADKSNERVLVYERIPGVSNPVPPPSVINTFSGVNPLDRLPFGLLDYPKMGAPVNGRQVMPILGWVAAPSAISRVTIAMDGGRGIEAAKQSRPDVSAAYPKMKSTGYKAELDSAYFADGNHRITVTAYSRDGSSRVLADVSVDIHFDFPGVSREANHPFGLLEYPGIGTSVTGKTLSILGWTVVPSGLGSIEILLDGRHVRDADRYSRPDVSNTYPDFPSTGFRSEVDLTSTAAGAHRISVISRGKDGVSRILAQVSVILQAG